MREIFIKSTTYSYVIIRDFVLKPYDEGTLVDNGLYVSEYKSLKSLSDSRKILISDEDYAYIKGKAGGSGGDSYTRGEVDALLETKLNIDGVAHSAYILTPGSLIKLDGKVVGSSLFTGESDVTINTELDISKADLGLDKVDNTSDASKPVSVAQQSALDLKVNKSDVIGIVNGGTGSSTLVGAKTNLQINNVDNTSDINKPISNLQQTALDSKVSKELIHEEFYGLAPTEHTAPGVDVFQLDFGVHLIRTDTAINGPPGTRITCVEVRKTHDEVGEGGTGSVVSSASFEQGTVSESSPVGASYSDSKHSNTEPLFSTRVRTIEPIPITEFSTVSIGEGFDYCVLFYDEDIKYLGKGTFQGWDTISRLSYPNARYIAIAVKKSGVQPIEIVPADIDSAGLTVTTLGQTPGGSKQIVAWGAMKGDLHTCVNIAGAWGNWLRISTPLPEDANEGDSIRYRSGNWVAEGSEVGRRSFSSPFIELYNPLTNEYEVQTITLQTSNGGNLSYKFVLTDFGVEIDNTEVEFNLTNNNVDIESSISSDGTITISSSVEYETFQKLYLKTKYKEEVNVFILKVLFDSSGTV